MSKQNPAWAVSYLSPEFRVMSTGEVAALAVLRHRRGQVKTVWYSPLFHEIEDWQGAPAYLLNALKQQARDLHQAGRATFWERTQDGGTRTSNLRYYDAAYVNQQLGIAPPAPVAG